ncbi:MAG TPA: FliM/FliN family flagellar motor C-terminal domain-containing protein [Terriglobales bacterium]|jgi:flagellar motor switch/type III secretory pathway protein FliN|nr:FliM/FliN family flagellar motor C-terminal domain-containing protein [Terriglobales bacterium]
MTSQPIIDAAVNSPDSTAGKSIERFQWLPCTLTLEVPVVGFTIGDLLRLAKGSIVQTAFREASDIPLHANGALIGWCQFEVAGERLAGRITELA